MERHKEQWRKEYLPYGTSSDLVNEAQKVKKFLVGEKQKRIRGAWSAILLKIPDNIYYLARQCTGRYSELALNGINFNPLRLSSFSPSFLMFIVVVTLDYRFL